MKKKHRKVISIVVIAAIIIGIYMYSQGITITDLLSGVTADRGDNGYWHSDTKECWATPTSFSPPASTAGVSIGVCCFDLEKYQVDCADGSKRLSNAPVIFEVFEYEGQPGGSLPGVFYTNQRIDISNTGTVEIDKVWIDSAKWVASGNISAAPIGRINDNYTQIIGLSKAKGPLPVDVGIESFQAGTFGVLGLDLSGNGTGTTYTLTLKTNASAYGGMINGSSTKTTFFRVTKEAIGYNVAFAWSTPVGP